MEVIWTKFATNSLFEILFFVKSQAGATVALKTKRQLFRSTRNIPKFPLSGKIEPLLLETGKEYRFKICGNYKIIYRVEGKIVYIIDVFDCRQNPEKLIERNS